MVEVEQFSDSPLKGFARFLSRDFRKSLPLHAEKKEISLPLTLHFADEDGLGR